MRDLGFLGLALNLGIVEISSGIYCYVYIYIHIIYLVRCNFSAWISYDIMG